MNVCMHIGCLFSNYESCCADINKSRPVRSDCLMKMDKRVGSRTAQSITLREMSSTIRNKMDDKQIS